MEIFSELYSVYYITVARILEAAMQPGVTGQALQQQVMEHAFSESVLTILPALKSGRWPLLHADLTPAVQHPPTMPLTTLEKRWLKAVLSDPRAKLFGVSLPGLEDVTPLFTRDDYRVYDQYADGDPFEDETYIRHFRLLRAAIREGRPVRICMVNRHGREVRARFFPTGFEYSLKDDKIRVLVDKCKFKRFNLARILTCEYYTGSGPWRQQPRAEKRCDLTLLITDERRTLERAMLHFAHFEKQAERLDEKRYLLRLKYYADDEAEMVIRVLSFGPYVQALAPERFVALIRERLRLQKSCGVR